MVKSVSRQPSRYPMLLRCQPAASVERRKVCLAITKLTPPPSDRSDRSSSCVPARVEYKLHGQAGNQTTEGHPAPCDSLVWWSGIAVVNLRALQSVVRSYIEPNVLSFCSLVLSVCPSPASDERHHGFYQLNRTSQIVNGTMKDRIFCSYILPANLSI